MFSLNSSYAALRGGGDGGRWHHPALSLPGQGTCGQGGELEMTSAQEALIEKQTVFLPLSEAFVSSLPSGTLLAHHPVPQFSCVFFPNDA